MKNIHTLNKQYLEQLNEDGPSFQQQIKNQIMEKNKYVMIHLIKGNYMKSLTFISQIKLLLAKLQPNLLINREIKIVTLNNLCSYHTKKYNYSLALKFINQALKLDEKQPIDHISITRTLFNKCILLILVQKHQEYLKVANLALQHLNKFMSQKYMNIHLIENINQNVVLTLVYVIGQIENIKITKELLEIYRKSYQIAINLCVQNSQVTRKMWNYLVKQNAKKNSIYVDQLYNKRQSTEYQMFKPSQLSKSPNKIQNRYIENQKKKKYKISSNRIMLISSQKKNRKQQMHQVSETIQSMINREKDSHTPQRTNIKKKVFEIYVVDKKKGRNSKRENKQDNDEMKELEKIKRIYEPLKSVNKISYIYQPNILQGTSKIEFLMLPINKSLCVNENSPQKPDNLTKQSIKHKSEFFDVKQKLSKREILDNQTKQTTQKKKQTNIKKKQKFNIKTKRKTQTPTLVTIQSFEHIKEDIKINMNKSKAHSKLDLYLNQCSLI